MVIRILVSTSSQSSSLGTVSICDDVVLAFFSFASIFSRMRGFGQSDGFLYQHIDMLWSCPHFLPLGRMNGQLCLGFGHSLRRCPG